MLGLATQALPGEGGCDEVEVDETVGFRVEDTILMGGHREPVTVCPERPTCQAAKEPSRCPHRQ